MHPKDCDCGRCDLPDYFKLLPGFKDLEGLKVLEFRCKAFEMKQEHEERALRRILSTGKNVLYLRDEEPRYSDPITSGEEVTAILFDVLNRFVNGGEFFTVQEIQIAAAELIHTNEQNCSPRWRLLLLIMGTCVNDSGFGDAQSECRELLKKREELQGRASQGAIDLLRNLRRAYDFWQDKVKENPEEWLFHFDRNGTANLISFKPHRTRASPTTNMGIADIPDCEIREIMARNEAMEKKTYPKIFNRTGGRGIGRVRPPYWPVALASDENGYRYLSDRVLDAILPKWRSIIDLDRSILRSYFIKWDNLQSNLEAWRSSEKAKLRSQRIREWPAPYSGQSGHGHTDSPSEVWHEVRDSTKNDGSDNEIQAIKVDKSPKKKSSKRSTREGSSQRDPSTSSRHESPFPDIRSEDATASGSSNRLRSGKNRLLGADEGDHRELEELKSVILEGMEKLESGQRAAFIDFSNDIVNSINKRLDSIEKKMRALKVRDGKEKRSASPCSRTSASPRWGSEAPSGFGVSAAKNSRGSSRLSEKFEGQLEESIFGTTGQP
ncbi:hypothetical protein N7493_001705 [Penicillium malachiteum]|uniref:Uncharacterized protein n=1 Tax=Penicillium malachiteum TaxID=1324776 RepID=A0AAD6HUM9_9EURO|nr:hypothetical protein N7493_001705 [Penicillium malachiteum]